LSTDYSDTFSFGSEYSTGVDDYSIGGSALSTGGGDMPRPVGYSPRDVDYSVSSVDISSTGGEGSLASIKRYFSSDTFMVSSDSI